MAFSQVEKPYLPSQQELAFPGKVVQNCFGINKGKGDITQRKKSLINDLPLSFILGGKSSRDFLNTWKFSFSDSTATDRIFYKIKWAKTRRDIRSELSFNCIC